ncbi:hypothetical protein LSAT2_030182 [Lamellibrachia satsuma]|nr:hypothetical protein LSAT2_030182 [Lamellibrachia satsuma]
MCFVATVFLLKFGLLFGDVMAKDWMKAVLTAVILDLLFIQPIVVVILALVRSLRGPVKPAAHPSQFVMCAREPVMTFVVGD